MNLTNDAIAQFLADKEWYDNSRIKMIRGCKRKAFYQLIGPQGQPLSGGVGPGANFGSSIHAALARYYAGWGKFDEPTRRAHGARAFAEEWGNYFPFEKMQSKHRLQRGLDIFDAYCEHYLAEDALFQPLENELGFCIEINTQSEKKFHKFVGGDPPGQCVCCPKPFWYIGRIDRVFKRLSDGALFLKETKTTSSQAEGRLRQLKFDHQPIGYTWCCRHLAGDARRNIVGVLGDVVLVAANKFEFARDYFPITQRQADEWRQQLIYTVEDWRALRASATSPQRFYQDTERCFEYGKCAFYELCDYGASGAALDEFEPATWNPLLQRQPPEIQLVNATGEVTTLEREVL